MSWFTLSDGYHELENPVLIANGSPSGREDGASGVPPSTSKLRFVK